MHRFLDREGEAGNVVVEERGAHAEARFVDQDAGRPRPVLLRGTREAVAAAESRLAAAAVGVQFVHLDRQRHLVAVHDVPRVRRQLVLDPGDEARPAVQRDARLAAEHHPQPAVEADEMIDVRVADEDVRQAQQFARRQRGNVAQVEQQRAPLVAKVDVQAGIAEGVVDQGGLEQRAHGTGSREAAGPL